MICALGYSLTIIYDTTESAPSNWSNEQLHPKVTTPYIITKPLTVPHRVSHVKGVSAGYGTVTVQFPTCVDDGGSDVLG